MAQLKDNIGILQSAPLLCFPTLHCPCLTSLMLCPQLHTSLIDFPHLYFITNLLGKFCSNLNLTCFILDPLAALVSHFLDHTINTSSNLIPNLASFLATLSTLKAIYAQNLALIGYISLGMLFSMKLSFSLQNPPLQSQIHHSPSLTYSYSITHWLFFLSNLPSNNFSPLPTQLLNLLPHLFSLSYLPLYLTSPPPLTLYLFHHPYLTLYLFSQPYLHLHLFSQPCLHLHLFSQSCLCSPPNLPLNPIPFHLLPCLYQLLCLFKMFIL